MNRIPSFLLRATILVWPSVGLNSVHGAESVAEKHPGDAGIAGHPAVVFVESFDHETIRALSERWEAVKNEQTLSLSTETPDATSDNQSLLITHVGGAGDGAHLYRRLPPGYDKLHVRFYVKFDPDCAPVHHFFHVGGYHPPTAWPQGGAGERPRGDERFSVGVEPFGDAWQWDYYAYWMHMRGSPPRGQAWGNSFIQDEGLAVSRGAWTCLALMLKMNDVDQADGEMALWVDGKEVSRLGRGSPQGKWVFDKFTPNQGGETIRWDDASGAPEVSQVPVGGAPFRGFRWRSDPRLNVNFLWPLLYITKAPEGHVSRVWFDNIVAATEYIGPIKPESREVRPK
ncbi:MAG: hypothetical protein AAF961_02875 [Planctomycetota bacterium]